MEWCEPEVHPDRVTRTRGSGADMFESVLLRHTDAQMATRSRWYETCRVGLPQGSAYHHYCPGRACDSGLNDRTVHTGQSQRGRQEGVGRDAAETTWPSRARRGYVRRSGRIIVGEKEHQKEEVLRRSRTLKSQVTRIS